MWQQYMLKTVKCYFYISSNGNVQPTLTISLRFCPPLQKNKINSPPKLNLVQIQFFQLQFSRQSRLWHCSFSSLKNDCFFSVLFWVLRRTKLMPQISSCFDLLIVAPPPLTTPPVHRPPPPPPLHRPIPPPPPPPPRIGHLDHFWAHTRTVVMNCGSVLS